MGRGWAAFPPPPRWGRVFGWDDLKELAPFSCCRCCVVAIVEMFLEVEAVVFRLLLGLAPNTMLWLAVHLKFSEKFEKYGRNKNNLAQQGLKLGPLGQPK